jgi:hypothetical protein
MLNGKISLCHAKYKLTPFVILILFSQYSFANCIDGAKKVKEALECLEDKNNSLQIEINTLKTKQVIQIPKGAVLAFNSDNCPSDGWSEYKLAYGRFIRGIDKSGKKVDTDGLRVAGSTQEQLLQNHAHPFTRYASRSPNRVGNGGDDRFNAPRTNASETVNTSMYGGSETRPKNIALLFCIKE